MFFLGRCFAEALQGDTRAFHWKAFVFEVKDKKRFQGERAERTWLVWHRNPPSVKVQENMKTKLFIALTLAATFCSTAFSQTNNLTNATTSKYSPYKQIDFNWSYSPNFSACSNSIISCNVGFTLKDTSSGATIATPNRLGPDTRSFAYFPGGGVQYGVHVFSLVANVYDANGDPLESKAATITVTVNR